MSRAVTFRSRLAVPAEAAFAWHERPGAFERLAPPWRPVRVVERAGGIRDGARVTLDLGFPAGRWRIEHRAHVEGRAFEDHQVAGPFARYVHTHHFVPEGDGCVLEDHLEWELPFAPLSAPGDGFVQREFERLFAWRHRVTGLDVAASLPRVRAPLTVGITGASGFVGRHLVTWLATQGHRAVRFVRGRPARADEIAWDPARGTVDPAAIAKLDAIVHLSGASLAHGAWTDARKHELVTSRVDSTATLARALASLGSVGPRVLVSTSAIGYYGSRGEEWLDEASAPGQGFLAELARRWEAAAAPAAEAGIRVVHPRLGIVLWPDDGALAPLVQLTRLGGGGPLGNGRAWWSWIGLHDLLEILLRAIETPDMAGPVNAVAPEPIREGELAQALGRVLRRPALLPAPPFALRLVMGRERADDMLLASQRVRPGVLAKLGHTWRDPELEPLLARLFGRPRLASTA